MQKYFDLKWRTRNLIKIPDAFCGLWWTGGLECASQTEMTFQRLDIKLQVVHHRSRKQTLHWTDRTPAVSEAQKLQFLFFLRRITNHSNLDLLVYV